MPEMEPTIPYARQFVDDADVEAVAAALRSGWITQGPAIERFEKAVAGMAGVRHAVAVNSATAALHIACLAAGLKPGDRSWTSPITFVASANCALYCGAATDFVDIDGADANMSVAALSDKLERAARAGALPRVLIPVHFGGQSCDMARIGELAARHGVTVIEDASHAVGASCGGRPVGCCAHSAMSVFSFHPVKIITTAEGGMVTTNSDDLYARLIRLRSHGITRDPALATAPPDGGWAYEQIDLGFNYRMTDLQAALGASQLDKLPAFLARRRELAARYDRLLAGLPLAPLARREWTDSAWHLYVVRVRPDSPLDRRALYDALRLRGIHAQVHYIPVHTQPYYRNLGFRRGDFPAAEAYYREALSLPMFPALTDADQDRVAAALRELLS